MSDHDEILVRQAFGQLAHLTRQSVRPVGAQAAQARAVQRRTRRLAALVSLVVLIIVLPVAVFAAGTLRRNSPPIGPTPVPTTSTSPTTTNSPPATSTPSPGTSVPSANAGELANATVSLPLPKLTANGECGSGPLKYTNGHAQGGHNPDGSGPTWNADIVATAKVDVNHDGVDEIIAKATCNVSDSIVYLVAAVQRQPDGRYTTLATVVDPHTDSPIRNVRDFTVTTAGSVRVEVTNGAYEGPWDPPEIWQWREYGFSGGRFTQIAGPRTFAADPRVAGFDASGSITVGATAGDQTDLTLAVTVTATGPNGATVEVLVGPFDNEPEARPGANLGRCGFVGDYVRCPLGPLAPGDSRNLSLALRVFGFDPSNLGSMRLRLRTDGLEYPPVKVTRNN